MISVVQSGGSFVRNPWGARFLARAVALPLTVALALAGLAFSGCDSPVTGSLASNETGPTPVVLAPVPRGGTTPAFTVSPTQSVRLASPKPTAGADSWHPGTAVVNFRRLTVEVEMNGARVRLRCLRPKGATDLAPLTVCSFSGDVLAVIDIDQEISLEGFNSGQAMVVFDLGPAIPATAAAGAPAATPAPAARAASAGGSAPGSETNPRLVLDPLPILRILNHTARPIRWNGPDGQTVTVEAQDRGEVSLAYNLVDLHKVALEPRDLVIGRLYLARRSPGHAVAPSADSSAAEDSSATLYFSRGSDNRLMLLAVNPRTELWQALGEGTTLVVPPPGGRVDLRGPWRLDYTPAGDWVVAPLLNADGSYPPLCNASSGPVIWRNRMSAEDLVIPPGTWRLLKPLP